MTTTEQTIATLRENTTKYMDSARTNRDLSDYAKHRAIARGYLDLKAGLASIEAERNKTTNERQAQLARKLYGLPANADASAMISYRDALDRASQIDPKHPSEATALLQRARTVGDDLLVRAVIATAYEREWSEVINAHLEHNPGLEAEGQELWDLNSTTFNVFQDAMDYQASKPRELGLYTDYQLQEMAADETPVASVAVYA
jgi:phage tail protein X